MDSGEGVEAHPMEYQKNEEVFEDNDSEGFDTLLSFGLLNQLKYNLKILKERGIDILVSYRSYF